MTRTLRSPSSWLCCGRKRRQSVSVAAACRGGALGAGGAGLAAGGAGLGADFAAGGGFAAGGAGGAAGRDDEPLAWRVGRVEISLPAADTANHAAPNAVTPCPLTSPGFWSLT